MPLPALVMKKLIGPVDGVVTQAASSVVAAAVRAKARILRIGAPWSVDEVAKPVLRAASRNPSSGSSLHRERGLPFCRVVPSAPRGGRIATDRHTMTSATIFLSAFLLFLVQPIIAKLILPQFGGGVAVWATCLVFFQITLLLGYAYAHQLVKRDRSGRLRRVHIALLLVSLLVLPIIPGEAASVMSGSESECAHRGAAAGHHRPAVRVARHHQSAAAGVAGARRQRARPVPPVRGVEPGVAVRADVLPMADRAVARHRDAGACVVGAVCAVRVARDRGGDRQCAPCAAAHAAAPHVPSAAPQRRRAAGTGRAGRHRRQAAARLDGAGRAGELRTGGGDQPPDAERAIDPDDVGAAARRLPAHVHLVFRRRPLVPAGGVSRRRADRGAADVLDVVRRRRGAPHRAAGRHLRRRLVRRVHVLPRRARARPPAAAAADAVLPVRRRRRRARRRLGRPRCAGAVAGLLRGRDRPRAGDVGGDVALVPAQCRVAGARPQSPRCAPPPPRPTASTTPPPTWCR